MRDTAKAFSLALENKNLIHEVFFIPALDTCSKFSSVELAEKYWPGTVFKKSLEKYESLISTKKARELLGYIQNHTWRNWENNNWA